MIPNNNMAVGSIPHLVKDLTENLLKRCVLSFQGLKRDLEAKSIFFPTTSKSQNIFCCD